jgi:GT2 family glycosyltransferase
MKKIAISILNYNSSNDCISLLQSLKKYDQKLFDIWVIDGASPQSNDTEKLNNIFQTKHISIIFNLKKIYDTPDEIIWHYNK